MDRLEIMPFYHAAETKARAIVLAKQNADADFKAGLTDPILSHFIKRLCPEGEEL